MSKNISTESDTNSLKKNLYQKVNIYEIIALTISNIAPSMTIGLNILILIKLSGVNSLYSLLVVGFIFLMLAIQLASLAFYYPSSGGTYAYISSSLSPFLGFILVVETLLLAPFSLGNVPIIASQYIVSMINDFFDIKFNYDVVLIVSIMILFATWLVVRRGIIISSLVTSFFELFSIVVFVSLSIIIIINNNFNLNIFNFKSISFKEIGEGFVFCVYSYNGFQSAGHFALEARNRKDAPLAIIFSLVISVVVFSIITYALLVLAESKHSLLKNVSIIISGYFKAPVSKYIYILCNIAIVFAILSGCISMLNTYSRLIYNASKHKIIHKFFSTRNKKNNIPVIAINTLAMMLLILPISMLLFNKNLNYVMLMMEPVSSVLFLYAMSLITISAAWRSISSGTKFTSFIMIFFSFMILISILFIAYGILSAFPEGIDLVFFLFYLVVAIIITVAFFVNRNGKYFSSIYSSFNRSEINDEL